jgi:predicted DNA-binding transcriptional regulator AlpA
LLRKPEVLDRVGLSFVQIWLLMREGKFPPARSLGGVPAWLESDIDNWIKNLPVRRYKALSKKAV